MNVNPRAKQAMDYFQSQGWTQEQAAGIVGNLQAESFPTLNPAAKNGNAEGIAQWLGPRKAAFVQEYGVSPSNATFEQQLSFVQKELTTTEKSAGNALKSATTAEEAARIFERKYERSGGSNMQTRVSNASKLMSGEAYTGPVANNVTAKGAKLATSSKNANKNIKVTTGVGSTFNVYSNRVRGSDAGPRLGVQNNVLEQFSSFDCIFTISCLSDKQVNFPDAPDSYKSGQLGRIILRSAGGRPTNRVSTAYTSKSNPDGKFDFFIDNVSIETIMSYNKKSKGTNATTINFDIYEPYSMGLFLQSLQLAAAENGHKNYIDAPYLLTIEFIGRDQNGDVVPIDDSLDRHIPFQFNNTDLTVTASGCTYKVEARPWNEMAFQDSYNLLKIDLNISGTTVAEILQTGESSLQYHLNKRLEEMAKQGSETGQTSYVRDEIVILFPQTEKLVSANTPPGGQPDEANSATKNPNDASSTAAIETQLTLGRAQSTLMLTQSEDTLNPIGSSEMGFDVETGGHSASKKAEDQTDPKKGTIRSAIEIDHKNKTFRFPQGTSIVNAISEILVMSEYCKKSANSKNSDSRGMKPWYRIESRVYNLPATAENDKRGRSPKLIVYNVVEYDAHESRFAGTTSQAKGYEELEKDVAKKYNYIYTGKNVDVLNFNIRLEHSMFTTVYSDRLALSNSTYAQLNGVGVSKSGQPTTNMDTTVAVEPGMGNPREGDIHVKETTVGGGPREGYRELVAKAFQESLLNSPSDMLSAEMEILGDPYFIADSGMGNFSDTPVTYNLNKNGSMNYQSGEVDILVNFRTPIDYDPTTGYMDFGNTVNVDGFSGLYQVMSVRNSFTGGKFLQTLDLVRRKNQKPSTEDTPTAEQPNNNPSGATNTAAASLEQQQKEINAASRDIKDDGKPATARPGQETKTAIDASPNGSTEQQLSETSKGIPVPGNIGAA